MQKHLSNYKVFNDVESTGLSTIKNDVIVSSFIVTDLSLNVLDKRTFRLKPLSEKHWDIGAERIHGISFEQAMTHVDTALDILWFFKPFYKELKYAEFIQHSLNNFDFNFMEWLFRKNELQYSFWKMFNYEHTTSTVKMSKEKLQLENNKLDTICKHFGIELNHHNAESDVNACYEIYKRLV